LSDLPVFSLDHLLAVSLSYRSAPVELREKLAFPPDRLAFALNEMRHALASSSSEIVLLSTCNRTEVYAFAADPPAAQDRLLACLAQHAHLDASQLAPACSFMRSRQAALHLLQVASGLDSLVIGEQEILGQVKLAFEAAQAAGTCGAWLSALFRSAIQTGKRVRTETEIGRTSLSIAAIVVELSQQILGSLDHCTALLVGAGKISSMTARALAAAGLSCILVANRTFERAQKLAASLAGQAVHFDQLPRYLAQADIVICSTGAPHTVLHTPAVQEAMATRPARPMLVADLAVPRDVDPEVAQIHGVHLCDIDDLDHLVRAHHPLAASTRSRAEEIAQEELACFEIWIENRRNADLICALNRHANRIVQAQVQKTTCKLGDLTPRQQQAIEKMGLAIASQLLRQPIQHLKTYPENPTGAQLEEMIHELFGIS